MACCAVIARMVVAIGVKLVLPRTRSDNELDDRLPEGQRDMNCDATSSPETKVGEETNGRSCGVTRTALLLPASPCAARRSCTGGRLPGAESAVRDTPCRDGGVWFMYAHAIGTRGDWGKIALVRTWRQNTIRSFLPRGLRVQVLKNQ